jgi:nicotinamidase-related amidase
MNQNTTRSRILWGALLLASFGRAAILLGGEFAFELRSQRPVEGKSGKFERVTRHEDWKAEQTAVIVCDVWDLHHCLNAVRRLTEFAPRLNEVLTDARRRGAFIIHAPSGCMEAYTDHPARRRAITTPKAATFPAEIESWCKQIASEEKGIYPIDQSDGGEDDDPTEHAEWAAKLAAMGRNPKAPWKRQLDVITIDPDRDYITDRGGEVWSILEQHGIRNVVLTGVHCNMCVLGRPFGLRQMARNGKNVVLMRDLTDSMYNPMRWPYVDHFTGNDLVISHVERFVCPTITSSQVLGGQPFRWKADTRELRDITEVTAVDVRKPEPSTRGR